MPDLKVIYEDNHIIAVNKTVHDLVQGDKTGDVSLDKRLKQFLKEKYNKPGNVYLGVTHRLDRPTSGVVLFAKTSKALTRLNDMFRSNQIKKTYWAVVATKPARPQGTLQHFMIKNEKQNKSYCYDDEKSGAKLAILDYELIQSSDRFHLLKVNLRTGRHHQIRAQLASIGSPIKGDLKYGAKRSNKDGGISLHARQIELIHPVSKNQLSLIAPVPEYDSLWSFFETHNKK